MKSEQPPQCCPVCGDEVHSDYDPKRKGWLVCDTHGPVWMPLGERWIEVRIHCTLEEASRRAARLLVALERASR